ncbi:phage protease [Pseudoalteromonas obscura]|uniref:Phage protease n=1 Tax=Pseudoalteromonas obscura TaxID=3048491 RepID=A0ABT7EUC5_9GAMM|nr:phage protease [Pseudoalteromonas sp. P94(2023)]MDK2598657.1 phage protease [Pseudoalteromonas sp. P94(2023)]
MKLYSPTSIGLAVCSQTTQPNDSNVGLAVCNLSDQISDTGTSARVLIIPDGLFSGHDGRPKDVESGHWLMDAAAFQFLQLHAEQRPNDYLFDYEHQTLHKEKNGQPAPAAGWFKPDALQYVPGEGVYAENVEWTDKAVSAIRAKEYRYVSPVFLYDTITGRVLKLLHVALTNDPAILGMDEVAILNSQFTQFGVPPMNEAQKLLTALGVTVDGDVTDAHITQGQAAIEKIKQEAQTAQAALTAQQDKQQTVDLSKYVPIESYNALHTQYVALSAEHQVTTVDAEIDKAKQDGRIIEAEVDYFKKLGEQQGVAALTTMLETRKPIAALTTQQTKQTQTPPEDKKKGLAALTADDKYAADQLGMSHQEFADAKEEK